MGLMIADYRRQHPVRSGRTLVIAPRSLLDTAWGEDHEKWFGHLSLASLWAATPAKRQRVLQEAGNKDICVINPEGFKRAVNWCLAQRFDNLIIDESSMLKSPKSQITKLLCRYAKDAPFVYPMSGTPMPNSPLEIFHQIYVVDQNLLGNNYYSFRAAYGYQTGYGGYQWRVTPAKRDQLMNRINSRAIFIAKEDCLDLPPQTFSTRKVFMSPAQREAYTRMVRDKILPLVNGRVALASNALAEIMKLRQITSGWAYDEHHQAYEFTDTKARVLDEVLDEIGPHQVLIWVQFLHDAKTLSDRLPNSTTAIGGLTPRELKARLDRFKAGEVRYLIAHPKTVAHGQTLVNCNYCIYYSLGYSLEEYQQSQDRIHRWGQDKNCFYISLLCEDSIDETIYKALRRKENMSNAAMAYLRGLTGD